MAYDGEKIENDNDDSSLGLMVFQEIEETKREDGEKPVGIIEI